ncbi:MAG TPA: hypothetical protein VGF44_01885 [Terriglobales bacterium]|jgi:hypothetical protein
MRFLTLGIFLLASSLSAFSSAAVVMVDADGNILMAEDSAITHTNADTGKKNNSELGCKIFKEGNFFFLAVGALHNPDSNFYVESVTRDAIKQAGSLRKLQPYLATPDLHEKLARLAEITQRKNPGLY